MDRMPMTDDEIARCEQYAADEEAERYYQEMEDHEQYMAEQEANSIAAEAWYANNDKKPIQTDLF